MRKREEIEESPGVSRNIDHEVQKAILEVLLDVRELLEKPGCRDWRCRHCYREVDGRAPVDKSE